MRNGLSSSALYIEIRPSSPKQVLSIYIDMLQLLQAREEGMDPPWLLPRVYSSQRFIEIELSRAKGFSQGHKRGVASIDIEQESGR